MTKLILTPAKIGSVELRNRLIQPSMCLYYSGKDGEITEKMAAAVSRSRAEKVLIPVAKCQTHVAGAKEISLSALIDDAAEKIALLIKNT